MGCGHHATLSDNIFRSTLAELPSVHFSLIHSSILLLLLRSLILSFFHSLVSLFFFLSLSISFLLPLNSLTAIRSSVLPKSKKKKGKIERQIQVETSRRFLCCASLCPPMQSDLVRGSFTYRGERTKRMSNKKWRRRRKRRRRDGRAARQAEESKVKWIVYIHTSLIELETGNARGRRPRE